MWYVYILQCQNGKLYTGTTNDVERRIKKHREGKGARYTRIFGVDSLLYKEEYKTRSEALRREAQIKGLTRKGKLILIKENGEK
ncbi:GIY-YIG nuclease family protein [Elusimicrobiota bacterium]